MSAQQLSMGEIEAINERLAELEAEKEQLLQRKIKILDTLKLEHPQAQMTTDEKILLFKALFKGRTDIYATRWENAKGKSGYSVACKNEWKRGVCNKPRIKCNECLSREYKQFNENIIYGHLTGKQVVGLYPLLVDNTCHLLAIDFDKSDWREAVRAVSKSCKLYNIPYAIEVSRSGYGAHLWIFFVQPVQAKNARLLGFGLLDKAMEIHPDLSFESYDRLLPILLMK